MHPKTIGSNSSTWVFATVLPGHRNGQSLAAQRIFDEIEKAGHKVRHLPIRSRVLRGIVPGVAPLVKAITTCIAALRLRHFTEKTKVYYCPNAKRGAYIDILFFLISKNSHQYFLHHHVASYINEPTRASRLLFRRLPSNAVHIFSCAKLHAVFERQYGKCRAVILPLTFMDEHGNAIAGATSEHNCITIGHLSNLSTHKGLERIVRLSRRLIRDCRKHRILLAGPPEDDRAMEVLEQIKKEDPQIFYLGPIYGEDKDKFFRSVDLFLFPSDYKNETWGIVVTEATGRGIPTIVYDVACVSKQVPEGYSINPNSLDAEEKLYSVTNFVMDTFTSGPSAYQNLRRLFKDCYLENLRESTEGLNTLLHS